MINVNSLKPGQTFLEGDFVFVVISATHSKSGRGQSHVKVKVRNLLTDTVTFKTFVGGDKVRPAFVDKKNMQFLYFNNQNATFMDLDTYEQIDVNEDKITWEKKYLAEGAKIKINFFNDVVIGVELPKNVELEVIEAAEAVKGDTVTNATKKATLETGIVMDVPQFIQKGNKIIINTEKEKYAGKA